MNQDSNTTHFGFETIKTEDKTRKVAEVFHSVASKYDLMNDLMSGGMHRLWKKRFMDVVAARTDHKILDVAGGTGDIAAALANQVGPNGKVVLSDINHSMLKVGKARLIDKGIMNNVEFIQTNAEHLAVPDNYFDRITISFGLRNVTDKDQALRSMYRALKPGGKLAILEFSKPDELVKKPYDLYSFKVLPWLGDKVANDADSYKYLAESIRMHPDQKTLLKMLQDAGFEDCHYLNLTFGVVAIHWGYKI